LDFHHSQELNIVNASMSLGLDTKVLTRGGVSFPNGNYKYKIKFYDAIDDHIGSGTILAVIKDQTRDVEF
jgi:hypothetical protein